MEVQIRIFFLCVVMVSSATEDMKKDLTVTEGGSITFPDPVEEHGFLFGANVIAMVQERKVHIYEEIYKDKLLWNSNTGLFTITGLQRNDSGIYKIDSKKRRVFITSYKLTVYESVPTPAVKPLNVSAQSCTLLCFVEKDTTLLWFKDEEIVNQSSSILSLPISVQKQDFSSSYRCVASNPAENKTLPVHVTAFCGQNDTETSTSDQRHHIAGIVFPILSAVIVILAAVIVKMKCFDQNKKTTRNIQDSVYRESEVQYADVHVLGNRLSQGGLLPESSGPVDHSNLMTVYDKLEAHRMVSVYIDTADHVYDDTKNHTHT